MKLFILLILTLLISTHTCYHTTDSDSEKTDELSDGIQTSMLADAGMNKVDINEIIDSIHAGFYPNRHSLLIYKKDLTIEHLLTMSSGPEWNEDIPWDNPKNIEMLMTTSRDRPAYILNRPMAAHPRILWKYNGEQHND